MSPAHAGPGRARRVITPDGPARYCALATPLGEMLAGATADDRLCLLEFTEHPAIEAPPNSASAPGRAAVAPAAGVLGRLAAELAEYFAGGRREFGVPIAMCGTGFQRRVWESLLEIPHGSTMGYGEVAARIGSPGAARAVGAANRANRIAIVIPCHRVIESSGALRGYAGGVWRKRALLGLEGAIPATPPARTFPGRRGSRISSAQLSF